MTLAQIGNVFSFMFAGHGKPSVIHLMILEYSLNIQRPQPTLWQRPLRSSLWILISRTNSFPKCKR